MKGRALALLVIALVFALYVHGLPSTVQPGDGAELALAEKILVAAHAPGYPLQLWLGHVFELVFPFGTVFWRLSLLSALFATLSLGVLLWPRRERKGGELIAALAAAAGLAFSGVFWRETVLPDVFALHALMTAVICAVYLRARPGAGRTIGVIGLFFLGMANHHTTVFLAPLVVDVLLEKERRALALEVFCVGIVVCALLYLSLLAMDPQSPFASGQVDSVKALVRHFLRSDYGTFRLNGRATGSHAAENFAFFLRTLILDFKVSVAFGLGVAVAALRQKPRSESSRRLLAVGAVFVLYVAVFLPLINIPPVNGYRTVVERFFVMPLVLLTVFAVDGASIALIRGGRVFARPALLTGALLALLLTGESLARSYAAADYSRDTVLEDYALNLLNVVGNDAHGSRSMVIIDSDEKYFALRYVQGVLGVGKSTVILNMGNLFDKRVLAKARLTDPELKVREVAPDADGFRDLVTGLIEPNLGRTRIYFTRDVRLKGYRTTYLPLGRRLSSGTGLAVDSTSSALLRFRTKGSDLPSSREYRVSKDLFSEYAYVHLADGLAKHAIKDDTGAARAFEEALALVPYCIPAQKNACLLAHADAAAACRQRLSLLQENEFNYY